MARYYFDLIELGELFLDQEGRDCPDLGAARQCAVEAARDIMGSEVRAGRLCLSHLINVRDGLGNAVMTLSFGEAVELSG